MSTEDKPKNVQKKKKSFLDILGITLNINEPENYKKIKFGNTYIKEENVILLFSIIGALIILIIGLILKLYLNYVSLSILILVIYAVGAGPYIFYKYVNEKIRENILDNYPYFLSYLSDSLSSGMTLLDALYYVSNLDLGYLSNFVRKLYSWIKWGYPFEKAFSLFNMYFDDIPDIKGINNIILESYKGGGDLSKVLKRLYTDLQNLRDLEKLKKAYISQQTMVLYAIFLIFIGLMISILNSIQPLIASQFITSASTKSTFSIFSYNINYQQLKFVTEISIIIIAISTSIIMGIAESGKILSSFKHIGITSFIAILSIIIFILPEQVSFTLNVYPNPAYAYSPVNIQIYATKDAIPISNVQIILNITGIDVNYSYVNNEILQNGYYSTSLRFTDPGQYLIIAQMDLNGQKYTAEQKLNITI
ncbi:MAG: type II secretion system F family protein [Nanopusillaceae archaeon]